MNRRRITLVAVVLLLLAVFAAVPPGAAVAAPPAWQISQLTTSLASPFSYQPDTDGVWLVYLQDKEVMARNLSTGETHQLSNDGTDKTGPLVDNDSVIWSTVAASTGVTSGYLCHLPNGQVQDLGPIPGAPVSYDDGRFAYTQKLTDATSAVGVYDLSTKQSVQVTGNGDSPSIRGNYLGYVNVDAGNNYSMCFRDLTTTKGVKVSTGHLAVNCVSVTDAYVLWCIGSGDYMEVYSMNRATLEIRRLTTDANEDREPRQAGNLIVWESRRPDWEVMAYNITTGETVQVTSNDTSDTLPCTDGTNIYYQGQVGADADYELMKASPASTAERPFADVPADYYYEQAIDGLYGYDIIDGHRIVDGKRYYDPLEPVTRAQFAKMVIGTLGVRIEPASGAAAFVDLGAPDVSGYPDKYVATILKYGVTRGVDATHYGPWLPITRAQVVTMLVRAASTLRPGFLQDPPAGYTGTLPGYDSPDHAGNLRIAEYNHLLDHLDGFGSGWDPEAPASRAECAQLMWNYLSIAGFAEQ